jgi:hypothetical protein
LSNFGWNLQDSVHALALVHLAIADCMITNIAVKFRFNTWRPYQALLIGGFSAIQPVLDSLWVSYLVTPDSSEYPAGHPTHGIGAAMALKLIFGFNTFAKNITIQYDSKSCRPGASAGSQIATNTFASFLKPLKKRKQC